MCFLAAIGFLALYTMFFGSLHWARKTSILFFLYLTSHGCSEVAFLQTPRAHYMSNIF